MREQAADEVVAQLGQAVPVAGVREDVPPGGHAVRAQLEQRPVQVGAVPGLVGDGLRGEAGPHPAAERHAPHRLPVQQVVVGRAQRRGVPDHHFLLAVTELGIVVLDLEPLRLQRLHQVQHEVVRALEAGGGVAQAVVGGQQPVRAAVRVGRALAERELRFERGAQRVPLGRQFGDGLLEEGPRARLPRLPVRPDQVRRHRGRAGRIRQRDVRLRVGHDADLTDGAHALHRLEVVEHVHRHHRDRVPDAARHPGFQARDVRGLAADDPAVVGIEEPHQRDLPGPGVFQDGAGGTRARLVIRGGGFGCVGHGLRVARCTPARTAVGRIAPLPAAPTNFSP